MFKERRYQGLFPYIISGIVLLTIGLSFFLYYMTHFGANQLSSQGKILNSTTKTGNTAVQVIYIYPNSVPLKERGTELYLIGYADKANRIGYIGLEASPNDSDIKQLYQDNEELIDRPYALEAHILEVATFFNPSDFKALSAKILRKGSALEPEIDQKRLLSLALAKNNRDHYYLLSIVFLVIGLACLVIVYQKQALNQQALVEFYDLYPELEDNLSKAESYAHLWLEKCDMLIYNDHLLTYGRDIRLLHLRKLKSLRQAEKLIRTHTQVKNINLPILYAQPSEGKSQTIRLKKVYPINLNDLFDYLNRYFSHIKIEESKTQPKDKPTSRTRDKNALPSLSEPSKEEAVKTSENED